LGKAIGHQMVLVTALFSDDRLNKCSKPGGVAALLSLHQIDNQI